MKNSRCSRGFKVKQIIIQLIYIDLHTLWKTHRLICNCKSSRCPLQLTQKSFCLTRVFAASTITVRYLTESVIREVEKILHKAIAADSYAQRKLTSGKQSAGQTPFPNTRSSLMIYFRLVNTRESEDMRFKAFKWRGVHHSVKGYGTI
jgi:hypothetical protein